MFLEHLIEKLELKLSYAVELEKLLENLRELRGEFHKNYRRYEYSSQLMRLPSTIHSYDEIAKYEPILLPLSLQRIRDIAKDLDFNLDDYEEDLQWLERVIPHLDGVAV